MFVQFELIINSAVSKLWLEIFHMRGSFAQLKSRKTFSGGVAEKTIWIKIIIQQKIRVLTSFTSLYFYPVIKRKKMFNLPSTVWTILIGGFARSTGSSIRLFNSRPGCKNRSYARKRAPLCPAPSNESFVYGIARSRVKRFFFKQNFHQLNTVRLD